MVPRQRFPTVDFSRWTSPLIPVTPPPTAVCSSYLFANPMRSARPSTDERFLHNPTPPVCARLVKRTFASSELPLLLEGIFSSDDESNSIHHLDGDDAQNFADVMDEARLTPVLHHEDLLIVNQFHRLGTGIIHSLATDPEKMSQSPVQNVRPQCDPSQVVPNPSLP